MPRVIRDRSDGTGGQYSFVQIDEDFESCRLFMSADEVKFGKPVFPGDTIFIHAELTRARGNGMAKTECLLRSKRRDCL